MSRSAEMTHRIMSSIKQRDTKPELLLRKELWRIGMRYRVNLSSIVGKPDIVFTKQKVAVFCDGDFWHGHNWAIRGLPSLEAELSNYSEFWQNKIRKNIEHDATITTKLESQGWVVIRIWESEILANPSKCAEVIQQTVQTRMANC